MKSPFPGMDPYIEACGLFEDFHQKLIGEIERDIADRLPDRYVTRIAERPYVVIAEADGKEKHVFQPDVGVLASDKASANGGAKADVAIAEPAADADSIAMRAYITAEYQENFIEIYLTDPERILVTCIEVLSPSNKREGTAGWDKFLRKRQGLLLGAANYVEVDLLRGGDKFPMVDPWPLSPYTVLVCRRARAPSCRAWAAHYRRALPTIPVPLASPDPDVSLSLQPLIDTVYLRSRYYRDIDYSKPVTPPMSTEDTTWLTENLRRGSA